MSNIVLEALKEKLVKLKKKRNKIINKIENNPNTRYVESHAEFSEFLNKFTGKERMSKEAVTVFNKINKKQEKAKLDIQSYNEGKLHNDLINISINYGALEIEISGLEYRMSNH